MKYISIWAIMMSFGSVSFAQNKMVKLVKEPNQNKVNVFIGGKIFTSFLYPDSLEKPVLYPLRTAEEL